MAIRTRMVEVTTFGDIKLGGRFYLVEFGKVKRYIKVHSLLIGSVNAICLDSGKQFHFVDTIEVAPGEFENGPEHIGHL